MKVYPGLFFLLVLWLCSIDQATAQEEHLIEFRARSLTTPPSARATVPAQHFQAAQLPLASLQKYLHGKDAASFRLDMGGANIWDLTLRPATLLSSHYELQLLTPGGPKRVSSYPDYLYQGTLKGYPTSDVRLTLKDGFFSLYLDEGSRAIYVESLNKYDPAAPADQVIMYTGDNLKADHPFVCRDTIKPGKDPDRRNTQSQIARMTSDTCLKMPVVLMADFQMYQLFGGNVPALEAALLDNLNQAQAYYKEFNFNATTAGDTGSDNLRFEVVKMVVSTCSSCDVVSQSGETFFILRQLFDWLKLHPQYASYSLVHYWTPRNLFAGDVRVAGIAGGGFVPYDLSIPCAAFAYSISQYFPQNTPLSKLVMAHETGHNFRCGHDDEVNSTVKGFVMQGSAPLSATRFSRFSDFGSTNYSSNQKIREFITEKINCMAGCAAPVCNPVAGLSLSYGTQPQQVQVMWQASLSVKVRLKAEEGSGYSALWEKEVLGNSITLNQLQPCKKYVVEVERICPGAAGPIASLEVRTPALTLQKIDTLVHSEQYDLVLSVADQGIVTTDMSVFVDKLSHPFAWEPGKRQVLLRNLVADGKRHTLELKDTVQGLFCNYTTTFTAPDGRRGSTVLLRADFNDCQLTAQWKDSVARSISLPKYNYFQWQVSTMSFPNNSFQVGTIDSSCFLQYRPYSDPNGCCGSRVLTSPAIDVSQYENLQLSFDHLFIAYKTGFEVTPFIKVEVWDGTSWQKVWERVNDQVRPSFSNVINIWDTMPPRVQIKLDAYRNSRLQVRFSIDDGWYLDAQGKLKNPHFFVALDNIKLDGYKINEPVSNTPRFTVFPNPTPDQLSIQLSSPPVENLHYRLVDLQGRVVGQGKVLHDQISLGHLQAGLYLLELYDKNRFVKTIKVIKT